MNSLTPGTELETVLLGGLFDGVLRLWRSDGTSEYRQIVDADRITSTLGRGVLARTSTYPQRFREVALFDARDDLLVLMARPRPDSDAETADAESVVLETRVSCHPNTTSSEDWSAWGRWLSEIVLAAAGRGEYVVVEPGGWDVVDEPYILLGVFSDPSRGTNTLVEALPAPSQDPWSGPADGRGGATLEAPATEANVAMAGLLAIPALTMWTNTPLEVVLTFGVNPGGPWHP